jgi:uncharacterized protein (TIGR00304 family)
MYSSTALFTVGVVALVVGFLIVFLAVAIELARGIRAKEGSKAEGGGIILIGPVPIVFGSSKGITKALLILGIVLTALLVLLYVLPFLSLKLI